MTRVMETVAAGKAGTAGEDVMTLIPAPSGRVLLLNRFFSWPGEAKLLLDLLNRRPGLLQPAEDPWAYRLGRITACLPRPRVSGLLKSTGAKCNSRLSYAFPLRSYVSPCKALYKESCFSGLTLTIKIYFLKYTPNQPDGRTTYERKCRIAPPE